VASATWTFDPGILLAVGIPALLYARGRIHLARAGHCGAAHWKTVCFGLGIVALALAFLSPLERLDGVSFAAHMLQHLLIVVVAAPLLVLGDPMAPVLWGLPAQERHGVGRLLRAGAFPRQLLDSATRPLIAGSPFLLIFGFWHMPRLYDLAQGRTLLNDLEHLSFFATALLFWWPVIHSYRRRRLGTLVAVPCLLAAIFEGTLIGALLTFAGEPLYATYRVSSGIFGMTPLEDQQLAGLLMWVPSGLVYLAAILRLVAQMLHEDQIPRGRTTPG